VNVLMITAQWLETTGGPTTYVRNLVATLERDGVHVQVLTAGTGGTALRYRRSPLWGFFDTLRVLTQFPSDVVHIHNRLQAVLPVWLGSLLLGRQPRIVYTFHTAPCIRRYLPCAGHQLAEKSRIRVLISRFLLRRCHAVTAVSRNIIRDLNEECGYRINRYYLIPSASTEQVADEEAVRAFRKKHLAGTAGPLLGSLGVLAWDWKVAGHLLAIEAVDRLRSKYPTLKLIIAGDGPYRPLLEEAVKNRGLAQHVSFLGNVSEAATVLAAIDIYLHLALNEACSVAILEAMYAGKAIVAADAGGIPEVLENGVSAILARSDWKEVANVLDELLQDEPLQRRLGEQARERARSVYNWQSIAGQYRTVYQGISQ